ncbi:AMP-binding protein [Flavobacterium agricola]|uniref:AMP-binding protein n=1 Tax=Flavobacterium agricola TaxID=2870839 RepID=A0ABY6M0H8_9FLAO|nr:AMP-binding protein [Flavobacterium agricola]UYW01936.1 AMP-binding protein [Flavobacterium agricola]
MHQKYINYVHPTFSLNGEKLDVFALHHKAEQLLQSKEEAFVKLGQLIVEWFNSNDYTEITTSGTTGTPKLIQIPKKAMVESALATGAYFNVPAKSKALHCLPVQYIAGKMMFIRAILLGWELTYVTPSSNPMQGQTEVFDFVAMVPLQVENALQQMHQIKKIIIGGAKVNTDLKKHLQHITTAVYETYGMTETVTHIAAKLVSETNYQALPNVYFSTDARGCLVIDAQRVANEPVVTNDVVTLLSETEFEWLGRADNVINSGGIKIFPEKVEEKLEPFISSRFFVAGIPDTKLGFKLILVVEGDFYALNLDAITTLNKYEVPKQVYFVPQFLETETSKIKRAAIIQQLNL